MEYKLNLVFYATRMEITHKVNNWKSANRQTAKSVTEFIIDCALHCTNEGTVIHRLLTYFMVSISAMFTFQFPDVL